jgi:hypothetical protein
MLGAARTVHLGGSRLPLEEISVSSLPLLTQRQPLGIVIRSGAPQPKPVKFWAYLWAADDVDAVEQHWHQRVPVTRAA